MSRALSRVAGPWDLTWQAVNVMIGAAIFGIPAAVTLRVGAFSPLTVLTAAAGVTCVAVCVAQLAAQYDASGGPYQYARAAFGEPVGGAVGWLYWMSRAASSAAVANIFVSNLSPLPGMSFLPPFVFRDVLIWGAVALNLAGFRRTSGAITALTIAKLVPLLGIGVLATVVGASRDPVRFFPAQAGLTAEAILLWVYGFGGFEAAVIPSEEATDPRRDAPVALYRALAIVTVVYVLLQFGVSRLWDGESPDRAVASVAASLLGPVGRGVVIFAILAAASGNVPGSVLAASRVTYGMASGGSAPALLGRLSRQQGIPHASIWLFGIVTWALAASGGFVWNATLSGGTRVIVYGVTAIAAWRDPHRSNASFQILARWAAVAFCGVLLAAQPPIRIIVVTLLGICAWAAVAIATRRCSEERG